MILTTPLDENSTLTIYGFGTLTSESHINYMSVALYPLFNAAGGCILGLVCSIGYNIWAKITGGIEIDISAYSENTVEQGAAANPYPLRS